MIVNMAGPVIGVAVVTVIAVVTGRGRLGCVSNAICTMPVAMVTAAAG